MKVRFKMNLISFFKKQYTWLIFIIFYAILIFSPFLRGQQRVHDSFLVEIFGYRFMTDDIFDIGFSLFNQGRVFSGMFIIFLDFIDIGFDLAMGISVFLSLIFLSISSFIILYLLEKYAMLA